jgi:hypothetical protein
MDLRSTKLRKVEDLRWWMTGREGLEGGDDKVFYRVWETGLGLDLLMIHLCELCLLI